LRAVFVFKAFEKKKKRERNEGSMFMRLKEEISSLKKKKRRKFYTKKILHTVSSIVRDGETSPISVTSFNLFSWTW
jgi:hypothetical protein